MIDGGLTEHELDLLLVLAAEGGVPEPLAQREDVVLDFRGLDLVVGLNKIDGASRARAMFNLNPYIKNAMYKIHIKDFGA